MSLSVATGAMLGIGQRDLCRRYKHCTNGKHVLVLFSNVLYTKSSVYDLISLRGYARRMSGYMYIYHPVDSEICGHKTTT